jgi:outer membrane protein OmpA-like peptidoglycan-associated protein
MSSSNLSSNLSSRFTLVFSCSLLLLLLLVACASGPQLDREQVLQQVDAVGALDARLALAEENGLDVLAPSGVASAREALAEAIASAQDGAMNRAIETAQQGMKRLDRAEADSKNTERALREVLVRRQRALAADAPTLLPERFERVEQDLLDAARQAERGDLEAAKDAGPELLQAYSALELDALKTDASDLARIAIKAARDAGAHRYAPQTFGRAQKELGIATGILDTDRSRVAQANVHARRATEFAARAEYIAELVQEFDRMDYDQEEIVLWYQEQLEELLAPLEGGISLDVPNHEAIADARSRIGSLVADQRRTAEELADARLRITTLELASTETTAELEARLARFQEAQREAEARYTRVQALFSADQAFVYRQGQDVLLETYGFEFPVGQSEIQSSNFGLLNKIARAIAEFDNPQVVVMGHTDATGNDELNQKLSDERAQKVGDFLIEVGGLDPSRVRTEGLGESRPVASNETAEGRARNRRIEVLIVNQPTSELMEAVSTAPPVE